MGEVQVRLHPVGVDRHPGGEASAEVLHVVDEDRGVGQHHPLGTGV